jgi:hypothetical protein
MRTKAEITISIDESDIIKSAAKSVAYEVDEDDVAERAAAQVAENIDEHDVAQAVAEGLSIDEDDVVLRAARQVASEIDISAVTAACVKDVVGDSNRALQAFLRREIKIVLRELLRPLFTDQASPDPNSND